MPKQKPELTKTPFYSWQLGVFPAILVGLIAAAATDNKFAIGYAMYGAFAVYGVVVPSLLVRWASKEVNFPTLFFTFAKLRVRYPWVTATFVALLAVLVFNLALYPWRTIPNTYYEVADPIHRRRVARPQSRRVCRDGLADAGGDGVHDRRELVLGDDERRRDLERDAAQRAREHAVAPRGERPRPRARRVRREQRRRRARPPRRARRGARRRRPGCSRERLEQLAQDGLERRGALDEPLALEDVEVHEPRHAGAGMAGVRAAVEERRRVLVPERRAHAAARRRPRRAGRSPSVIPFAQVIRSGVKP